MRPLDPLGVALEGTLLVEASAGTGKTHTITTLVARLVVERAIPLERVLVVTFTEAATAELRDRVRRRLTSALAAFESSAVSDDTDLEMHALARRLSSDEARAEARRRLIRAIADLDLAGISTIHSFCRQALEEHAFESGARFDLDFVTDLAPLVQDVADDHWATQTYGLSRDDYDLIGDGWTPETARTLVGTLARWPASTRVLPEEGSGEGPGAGAFARLRELYAQAAGLWKQHRTKISFALGSGALSKNSYDPADLGGWCDSLDTYFARDVVLELPEKLAWFGTRKIASALKKGQQLPTHLFFAVVQELLDLRAESFAASLRRVKLAAVTHTRRELARRKALAGVRSFDDLLQALDAALQGPHGHALATALRGRYSAALIDEFQDTDPTQYRIFRSVFHGHAPLLLVGDPKQSIYAFRGADIFSYFTAADDARSARYTLATSYRSDPSLVRAVNTVFDSGDDAFVFAEIPFHPIAAHAPADRITGAGPALELLLTGKNGSSEQIPALIAADIARLLRSGATVAGKPVVAADIAVLTRANWQAAAVQAELRELGIPTVLETEASVFDSPEADALDAVLRAIAEPNRADRVKTALASALVGLSAREIVDLETSEEAWDAWSERFRMLREAWQERGFIDMYRRLLRELGAEKKLLSLFDGERRLTNLSHLAELVHRAALGSRLGMASLLQWFARMREDQGAQEQALGSAAGELRIESDERAVKLLTIHKSKGLEYPIVYCPYLWFSNTRKGGVAIFHDERQGRELTLHLEPDEEAWTQRSREALAEDQRLLYVALTRARHKVLVVWGLLKGASSSSLAYALHRPWAKHTDESLRAALVQLAARAEGTIGLRDLSGATEERLGVEEPAGRELRSRSFTRSLDRRWRMTSFTALTKARPGAPVVVEEEERDRDEVEDGEAAVVAELGGLATPVVPLADVTLADFPRGSKAGTMLHEVFELHDFAAPESELRALVEKTLPRHGFEATALAEPLTRGVREILATPLDATGTLTLGALTRAQRLDELEFVFPVAAGAGASPGFARSRLAEVFARHPTDTVPARYADRLRALDFADMRGFLRGFVDLVFQHDGRFYVVDYKSNHLGRSAADYGPEQLADAMTHANYYLQYHLYVVALHRHLGRRLRDYSYERSFGGVYYLFARGMAPGNGKAGVFFDRPPQARIDALSRCLEGLAREDARV